jgi:hypothetical protein
MRLRIVLGRSIQADGLPSPAADKSAAWIKPKNLRLAT